MRKVLLSLVVMVFAFIGLAKADIFNPIDPVKQKAEVSEPAAFDDSTLLTDATLVIDYLGVKEGAAYSFEKGEVVNTTSATIVTYAPWDVSLDISLLDDDGVAGDIAWNAGAVIPVANVPILKYTEYFYVVAGLGGEENREQSAFKLTEILGGEFKFSF